jgi:hypothetical protein
VKERECAEYTPIMNAPITHIVMESERTHVFSELETIVFEMFGERLGFNNI